MKNPQIKIGLIGAAATALCCVTPILVVILGGLGATAIVAYLDWVLFPLLGLFLLLTGYGLYRWKFAKERAADGSD